MKHLRPVSREAEKVDVPFDLQFLTDLLNAILDKMAAKALA